MTGPLFQDGGGFDACLEPQGEYMSMVNRNRSGFTVALSKA